MTAPPNDAGAERAVLGSILIDSDGGVRHLEAVAHVITEDQMFYQESHRAIWSAMSKLGDALDTRTLLSALREAGKLDSIGGETYVLKDLAESVSTAAHIQHYARIVARLYYERRIIEEAHRLSGDPEPERIEPLRDLVMAREAMLTSAPSGAIADVLSKAFEDLDRPQADRKVMTGYEAFDGRWYGCLPGEVNVWGAAPNQGKSLMLANLMLRAAAAGHPCLIFGTEMSAAELSQRLIAMKSGLPARALRRGIGDNVAMRDAYLKACDDLRNLPMTIIDDPEPSLADVEVALARSGARVVFLDYLEQFALPRAESLRIRISECMKSLKAMARRRGVVVHLAAQLNRTSYGRGDEDVRPHMGMLSESSGIEKAADRVVLLWAPKSKNLNAKWDTAVVHLEAVHAKNRHGAKGEPSCFSMNTSSLVIEEEREFVSDAPS